MTVATALAQGGRLLTESSIPAARLTAEVLLSHAMKCERPYLYAHPEQELIQVQWLHFGRYLHERIKGKPTQYITGKQEFYGRLFRVTNAVMIPRPETEHVVEAALENARDAKTVLDVGTGSGILAVTLQLELGAFVTATDISAAALAIAAGNAARLGAGVCFLRCDLADSLAGGRFDLVVSNPPYVPAADIESLQREVRDWEPRLALVGGESGVEFYGCLIGEAERLLRPGGWLVMELGIRQLDTVRQMFSTKWTETHVKSDLAGLPRVLAGRLKD